MDYDILKLHLYDLNEDEKFYKNYYYARQQTFSHQKFLAELDRNEVINRRLIIPDLPETVPEILVDSWSPDSAQESGVAVMKHNRYTPVFSHKHTFFEIGYLYGGSCTQKISGWEIKLQAGDFFVIPPGTYHSVSGMNDDLILFNAMLPGNTLQSIYHHFLNTKNPLSFFFLNHLLTEDSSDYIIYHSGADPYIREGFLRMYWEYESKQRYYYQCIANTLSTIMYALIRSYEKTVEIPYNYSRSSAQQYEILQYMRKHLVETSLPDVAEHFHYSPEHTSRLIKDATGLTFSRMLTRMRMEQAVQYLLHTNMTVSAIGYSLGYKTPEHFIRKFRQTLNMTPTEYRKANTSDVS